MCSKIENHDAPNAELNDGDLDRVSGGTSGLMHAVAGAAYKVLLDANAMTPDTPSSADIQSCIQRGYCN